MKYNIIILKKALIKLKSYGNDGTYCTNETEHYEESVCFPSDGGWHTTEICPICLLKALEEVGDDINPKRGFK